MVLPILPHLNPDLEEPPPALRRLFPPSISTTQPTTRTRTAASTTLKPLSAPRCHASSFCHSFPNKFFIASDFAIRIERQLHLRFAFDQGTADTADGNAGQHAGHRTAKCAGE